MDALTHFDENGKAVMVDVSDKGCTKREATACGSITVNQAVYEAIESGRSKKGDVLAVATVAGIMAAKKTYELIPMCHILPIDKCSITYEMDASARKITVFCNVIYTGKTGVEMEALTGASVALLTIYDMCKALDRGMIISDVCLMHKSGGKSGEYIRN